jgi:hypothetical protein
MDPIRRVLAGNNMRRRQPTMRGRMSDGLHTVGRRAFPWETSGNARSRCSARRVPAHDVVSPRLTFAIAAVLNATHIPRSEGILIALPGAMTELMKESETMATEFARKDYEQSEGKVARAIEEQTAKLPSDTFLWMAIGSMAVSATMQVMGNKHASVFVGQWAPTFLLLGLYNKLVKQLGSDRTENAL